MAEMLGDTEAEMLTLGDAVALTEGVAVGETLGEVLGEMLGDTLGESVGETDGVGGGLLTTTSKLRCICAPQLSATVTVTFVVVAVDAAVVCTVTTPVVELTLMVPPPGSVVGFTVTLAILLFASAGAAAGVTMMEFGFVTGLLAV